MITIDVNQALSALLRSDVQAGIQKYLQIMYRLHKTNVHLDREFQKSYNHFYRIRQRSQEFYNCYYWFMEMSKNSNPSFAETLQYIKKYHGTYEASFSSKLIATINPTNPIWDKMVIGELGLKAPSSTCQNRMGKIIDIYQSIENWYKHYMKTNNALVLFKMYDRLFPNIQMTAEKKIDFALWAIGKTKT